MLTALSTLVTMAAYSGPLGNAPTLGAALSATPAGRTWILSSMSVGLAVSLLSVGALADDIGRRKMFVLGAWVFACGSALCAVADTATPFVVGRLVAGVGAAGMVATGLGLVAITTTRAGHRAAAASWWGTSLGAGIAVGPLLTGLLDLHGDWRAFYWLLALAGGAMGVAARTMFAESVPVGSRRFDLVGLVTMTGGLGLLLVTLIQVRSGALGQAVVGGAFAVVLLVAFFAVEVRGRAPLLDVSLFRRPDFVAATIAALATGGGVISLMSFACTFLVNGMGLSTFGAGALLTVWSATSALSAVLGRQAPQRFTGNPQLVVGLLGVGIGLLLLTALNSVATPWRLVPGLLVAGVASGVVNAGLGRQAVASVPPARAALGTGTNNTARYVGSSIGVTIVTVIAAHPGDSRAEQVAGWNVAALITGVISLTGAAVVAAIARAQARGSACEGLAPAPAPRRSRPTLGPTRGGDRGLLYDPPVNGTVLNIRPALDSPAVWRQLRLESLRESPRAFGSSLAREQAFNDEDWAARISDLSFIAYDADVPVGLGGGYRPVPGRVEVVSMWVRPDHRGRGLSRMLLDAVVDRGRMEGATFELFVDTANGAARGAYLSYGFVPTGETKPLSAEPGHLAEHMVLPA